MGIAGEEMLVRKLKVVLPAAIAAGLLLVFCGRSSLTAVEMVP
jgi:hypothetical protein